MQEDAKDNKRTKSEYLDIRKLNGEVIHNKKLQLVETRKTILMERRTQKNGIVIVQHNSSHRLKTVGFLADLL